MPHPFRVAPGQVIVYRYQVRAAASERVQVKRQRGDQSFAFAGRHLRDSAPVQNDTAEQLHVEVHHVPDHRLIAHREAVSPILEPARGVFHHRKCFRQNFIQLFPLLLQVRNLRDLFLPVRSFCPQLVVRQALELLVELVDPANSRHQTLELALIFRP